MASSVTLAVLVADARRYADMTGDEFRGDTEIERMVNQKLAEFYDLLVSARGQDYYITSAALSVVSGTASYSLPTDFYQLKTLTLEWSATNQEPVQPVNSVAGRIPLLNHNSWAQWGPKGYRIRGTTVEFLPTPTSAVTCRVQYIPTFTPLTNVTPGTTDVFDCINGWEKLITLGVAMELMEMEEAGTSMKWGSLYAEQLQRIQDMADDRDADMPMQIEDVRPDRSDLDWLPGDWYVGG
jgi:hypothetical protein